MESTMIKIFIISSVLVMSVGCSHSSVNDYYDSAQENSAGAEKSAAKSSGSRKAEQRADKKSEADSSHKEGNHNLIEAIRGHDDESIYRAATGALSQNPNDPVALNALGLYHLRKGRPLAAKLFFNKALVQKPNSAEIYSNLGLVYLAFKENKDAIRSFKKSLEIDGAYVPAGMNLGALYLASRDFNKAYSVLSLISSKVNHDLVFLNNFAVAAAEYGKLDEAEKFYKEALQQSPSHKETLYNYAVFQIDYLKKYKAGLETLGRLKFLGLGENMRNNTNALENRAKAGLK